MIGESFRAHFLAFRLVDVVLIVLGLVLVLRWSSRGAALSLLTLLAVSGWLFNVLPLSRPYGLEVGSPALFDAGLVARAAEGGSAGEAWILGERSPRPGWGFLWKLLSPGDAAAARDWVALPLRALLIWLLFVAWTGGRREHGWEALLCAFTACFAASIPLDAFRPYAPFERAYLLFPHRILALSLALGALALAWRGGRLRGLAAGVVAGAVGWVDGVVFLWLAVGLLSSAVLARFAPPSGSRPRTWPAAAIGSLIALSPISALLRDEALLRGLTPEDAASYAVAFRDVFSVTTDMEWIFFLALAAVPFLWRRGRAADLGALGLAFSAYLAWAVTSLSFDRWLLWRPETSYQLVRFATAWLAGAGAYRVLSWLSEWALDQRPVSPPLARAQERLRRWPREPAVFAMGLVLLLPASSVLNWHPLRMDPLYYPSWRYPLDPDDVELGAWLREHSSIRDVVVTGAATSEWVAALSGRRVLNGVRLVPRAERRQVRRELRALFLSGDPSSMRSAMAHLEATILVLDDALREEFWQADLDLFESSGVFRKVHRIGDRYAVYRLR